MPFTGSKPDIRQGYAGFNRNLLAFSTFFDKNDSSLSELNSCKKTVSPISLYLPLETNYSNSMMHAANIS